MQVNVLALKFHPKDIKAVKTMIIISKILFDPFKKTIFKS